MCSGTGPEGEAARRREAAVDPDGDDVQLGRTRGEIARHRESAGHGRLPYPPGPGCNHQGFLMVIRPCTMRFFQVQNPTVRFGAVLRKRKSHDAVRCGFRILLILRCGSVL